MIRSPAPFGAGLCRAWGRYDGPLCPRRPSRKSVRRGRATDVRAGGAEAAAGPPVDPAGTNRIPAPTVALRPRHPRDRRRLRRRATVAVRRPGVDGPPRPAAGRPRGATRFRIAARRATASRPTGTPGTGRGGAGKSGRAGRQAPGEPEGQAPGVRSQRAVAAAGQVAPAEPGRPAARPAGTGPTSEAARPDGPAPTPRSPAGERHRSGPPAARDWDRDRGRGRSAGAGAGGRTSSDRPGAGDGAPVRRVARTGRTLRRRTATPAAPPRAAAPARPGPGGMARPTERRLRPVPAAIAPTGAPAGTPGLDLRAPAGPAAHPSPDHGAVETDPVPPAGAWPGVGPPRSGVRLTGPGVPADGVGRRARGGFRSERGLPAGPRRTPPAARVRVRVTVPVGVRLRRSRRP